MSRGALRPALDLTVVFVCVLAVVYMATEFLARPWAVHGRSMEPTFRAGDRVIVDLWTYRQRPPRPGEVVLLAAGRPDAPTVVKRVAVAPAGHPASTGSLWVLGDNPADSADSRQSGAVPADRVLGRVVWVYWPPARFGPVSTGFRLPVR